ncbi:hypothetical protein [Alloactinosynnema sp. L-07]|nr:hypothetical protein [Alloactinosynnema sp. L-07]
MGANLRAAQSGAMVAIFNVSGYLLGRTIRVLCRVAAKLQVEVQQRNYEEFFNFLHSHVKAGVAAIRAEWGNTTAMGEKLNELEEAVSERRIEFLLASEQVPLAAVLSERLRTFAGVLDLTETPRVGALTVVRPVGVMVSRALGDLLKNAVLHGGRSVTVRLKFDAVSLEMDVVDNGPGLAAAVLQDDTRSLARLRVAALELGGDLTVLPCDAGAHVRLLIPLSQSTSAGRRRFRASTSSRGPHAAGSTYRP